MESISFFLPCRAHSSRVPFKNTRKLASHPMGLLEIKLKQLACVRATEIVVSTDSDEIIDYCKRQNIENLVVHKRPEGLCLDTTSTHQLIKLASQICTSSHVAWTHLTSPFFTSQLYADAIKCYFSQLSTGHDSLMAVYPIRGVIWNSTGPINYEASPPIGHRLRA